MAPLGLCLRTMAGHAGSHFQGLEAAARSLRIQGPLRKRLQRVDAAASLLRHITAPWVAGLLLDLEAALGALPSGPAGVGRRSAASEESTDGLESAARDLAQDDEGVLQLEADGADCRVETTVCDDTVAVQEKDSEESDMESKGEGVAYFDIGCDDITTRDAGVQVCITVDCGQPGRRAGGRTPEGARQRAHARARTPKGKGIGGSSSEPVKAARSRGHQAEDPHQQAGEVTGHSQQAGYPEHPGWEQSGEEENKSRTAEDMATQAVTERLENLRNGGGLAGPEKRAELAKDAGGSPHGPVKAARSRGHPAEDPHRQAGEEWGHVHKVPGDPEHPQGENTEKRKDKARSAKDMAIQETDERLQELLYKRTRLEAQRRVFLKAVGEGSYDEKSGQEIFERLHDFRNKRSLLEVERLELLCQLQESLAALLAVGEESEEE